MKKSRSWLFAALVLAVVAVAIVWQWQFTSQPPAPMAPTIEAPHAPAVQPPQAPTHYPIPDIANGKSSGTVPTPVPALKDSDTAFLSALGALWDPKTVAALFYPETVVRHIVATLDNLPRKRVSRQILPVKPVGGKFLTQGEGSNLAIAPANAARYQSYVRLVQTVDAKRLVALYVHFYPLFQQAYVDLGYPDGYFNDRLIAVIDHMLAGPEDPVPVRLIQPHVFYQFADPDLENSSAGHKLLLRMGPENTLKVKAKLREIRELLTLQNLT